MISLLVIAVLCLLGSVSSTMYAIVTGGNAGMGLAAATELCRLGYNVVITARSRYKADEAIQSIKMEVPDASVRGMLMELKDLESVRNFGREYIESGHPLNLLVNNAGIMNTPYEMTKDGFEAQFQVNHLGHFLLTHFLLPVLSKTGGRVINYSSRAHMRWQGPIDLSTVRSISGAEYDGWKYYGLSKLSNILFTRSLATKFPLASSNVAFFSLHPGLVDTKLLNVAPGLSSQAISIADGIRTALFLSTEPLESLENGEYYYECKVMHAPEGVTRTAQSLPDAEKLWEASLAFVGMREEDYGKP